MYGDEALNALLISDLQCPFDHRDALPFALHVDKTFFPSKQRVVVCMGDEVDQHTLGKWPASPNGLSGKAEKTEAAIRLSNWFAEFPKVYVCESNHTYRAWKKAFLAGIPDEFMKSVAEVYGAPQGWQWRSKWISHGWCFEHGENVSGPNAALNAAIQNQMPTAIGHQHSHGGVLSRVSENGWLFGLNTGCLIDVKQYAFDYAKNIRVKPSLGMGVILRGVPIFVPMFTRADGRWVGYV